MYDVGEEGKRNGRELQVIRGDHKNPAVVDVSR
jgi:hypothetical protein